MAFRVDCASDGQRCVDEGDGHVACVERYCTEDEARHGEVGFACDGNEALYCADVGLSRKAVIRSLCPVCVEAHGIGDCVPDATMIPCAGEQGSRCEGDERVVCEMSENPDNVENPYTVETSRERCPNGCADGACVTDGGSVP